MISKIKKIIQKNIRLLMRSRSSALIVILGPLILITLVGLAFSNSNPYSIEVSFYTKNTNQLTDDLLQKLNEERFNVKEYDSEEACIASVKRGRSNICLVLPENFQIREGHENNVSFHVDQSQINLVWAVLNVISSKVSEQSEEISYDLTSDLLQRMGDIKRETEDQVQLAALVAKKNSEAGAKIAKIDDNLKSLDLSIDIDEFKADDLKARITTIKNHGLLAVKEGNTYLEDVKTTTQNLNLSESKEAQIIDIVKKAQEDLEQIEDQILDMYDESNTSIIGDLISNLDKKLTEVKVKLDKASSTRKIVQEDLRIMDTNLQDAILKVNNIQSSMEKIRRSIDGLRISKAEEIVSPIKTNIYPIAPDKTHFNLLFPALIVLITMITGILLGSTLMMVEKKSKAYFRNFMTPTSDVVFIIGTYITGILVMILQIVVFLLISILFFKTELLPSIGLTSMILLLIISFFVLVGMFVGTIFKSEETTTLAAITVASIMLFFSEVVIPLESMPKYIMMVSRYNPFVVAEELLKQALLFKLDFASISVGFVIFLAYTVLAFILVIKVRDWLKVKLLYKIHKVSKFRALFHYRDITRQKQKEFLKKRLEKIKEAEDDEEADRKMQHDVKRFSKEEKHAYDDINREAEIVQETDEEEEKENETDEKIRRLKDELKKI